MPPGEDYRFLYVMLYNMGRGHHVGAESETKTLQQSFMKYLTIYKKECNIILTQWPEKYGWEELRMKRFLVGDGGPVGGRLPGVAALLGFD